jgi:hypothetical protein
MSSFSQLIIDSFKVNYPEYVKNNINFDNKVSAEAEQKKNETDDERTVTVIDIDDERTITDDDRTITDNEGN